MWADLRRRQTLASFDYQWRALGQGQAMLSDDWMREHADAVLADELLGIDRGWFAGRTPCNRHVSAGNALSSKSGRSFHQAFQRRFVYGSRLAVTGRKPAE